MKVQYASDLHLEFKANSDYLLANPLAVSGDYLILAGDTLLLGEKKLMAHPFLDWCADNYKITFLVPGNHEFYSGCELLDYLDDLDVSLRSNVRLVNNMSVVLEETEFFFSTLWTVIPKDELMFVQMGLTDCLRMRYDNRRFSSSDYEVVHAKCMSWLRDALRRSGCDNKVVVSHHCPTKRFVDPRFVESNINSAFCVDLDSFIETEDINVWIYGHTHYNGGSGSQIGTTLMLSNQMGYVKYGENASFQCDSHIVL